jgi:hypothetical protein
MTWPSHGQHTLHVNALGLALLIAAAWSPRIFVRNFAHVALTAAFVLWAATASLVAAPKHVPVLQLVRGFMRCLDRVCDARWMSPYLRGKYRNEECPKELE